MRAGWSTSFKSLSNGTRQIISFPIPGDCVGLRSVLLRTADHSFSALTDSVVSEIDAYRMRQCVMEFPRLSTALLWASTRDEAMVVEHLVNIGRRNAIERTAHLFSELAQRLNLIGQFTDNEFRCPLNQYVLADALGLSAIHVNRVLRQLREERLMTKEGGRVKIHDLNALQRLAGYQSDYLNGNSVEKE